VIIELTLFVAERAEDEEPPSVFINTHWIEKMRRSDERSYTRIWLHDPVKGRITSIDVDNLPSMIMNFHNETLR